MSPLPEPVPVDEQLADQTPVECPGRGCGARLPFVRMAEHLNADHQYGRAQAVMAARRAYQTMLVARAEDFHPRKVERAAPQPPPRRRQAGASRMPRRKTIDPAPSFSPNSAALSLLPAQSVQAAKAAGRALVVELRKLHVLLGAEIDRIAAFTERL